MSLARMYTFVCGAICVAAVGATGCTSPNQSVGGTIAASTTKDDDDEEKKPEAPKGFEVELVTSGLDFPTAVAFCEGERRLWVAESGILGNAAIKEIDHDGMARAILLAEDLDAGVLLPPLTDLTHHGEELFVAHRQMGANGWHVGAISKFHPDDPAGTFRTLLTNLPGAGDHTVNEIAFGRDGMAYISIGTATNSSVVGPDNELITMWLAQFPGFHDYPPRDIALSGVEYETDNPLTPETDDTAVTAPFMAFGSGPVEEGTQVAGASPESPQDGMIAGNGTVYRFDAAAEDAIASLELVAWGLRNPFGLAFHPTLIDRLYVTNNGSDIRGVAGETNVENELGDFTPIGARPVANDYDDLFLLDTQQCDRFYGWPDFFHHPKSMEPLPVTDEMFCEPEQLDVEIRCPEPVLSRELQDELVVSSAEAQFELHSSANKLDVSTSERFGHEGDLFVAETGSFVPVSGAAELVGYKVVRVDAESGQVRDFISAGETQEEIFDPNTLNKPIDVKFKDDTMIVVDFGVYEPGLGLQQPGTGKIWMIDAERPSQD